MDLREIDAYQGVDLDNANILVDGSWFLATYHGCGRINESLIDVNDHEVDLALEAVRKTFGSSISPTHFGVERQGRSGTAVHFFTSIKPIKLNRDN